ncbi:hypothetical protein HY994_02475 [Candidatus Micrarchaeota archaeon]|nr:hypothetical protein [Candidatus Micrarchaeota archaeon]
MPSRTHTVHGHKRPHESAHDKLHTQDDSEEGAEGSDVTHHEFHHPIEDMLGVGRNKHILIELAKASLALRNATRQGEKEGMEELIVYLALELEKRARYSHYYDELKAKHPVWFTRIAGQFRIGARVSKELNANRQNPAWIHQRVEFWAKKAINYYWNGILPETK